MKMLLIVSVHALKLMNLSVKTRLNVLVLWAPLKTTEFVTCVRFLTVSAVNKIAFVQLVMKHLYWMNNLIHVLAHQVQHFLKEDVMTVISISVIYVKKTPSVQNVMNLSW